MPFQRAVFGLDAIGSAKGSCTGPKGVVNNALQTTDCCTCGCFLDDDAISDAFVDVDVDFNVGNDYIHVDAHAISI